MSHHRLSLGALLAASSLVAACHNTPKTAATPVAQSSTACGSPAAIAVLRGTPKRLSHARTPGSLVIRVAPADSGFARPVGSVRLVPTSNVDGGATKTVKLEGVGTARSGPLEAGRWVVEASGRGYETGRLTVAVRSGATDTVRFRLSRACAQRASR